MTEDILSQWEADIEHRNDIKDERILALIDLVRKKDEISLDIAHGGKERRRLGVFKFPYRCPVCDSVEMVMESLALTKELK